MPDDRRLAFKILTWIYYAKCRLGFNQLREALSVEDGDASLPTDLISREDIIECCQGLVVEAEVRREYHEPTELIFAHGTVKEFLQDRHIDNLQPHYSITKVCLTYLGFSVFNDPCENMTSLRLRNQKYRFTSYAARYWAEHARDEIESVDELRSAILRTFESVGKRESIEQFTRAPRFTRLASPTGKTLLHFLVETRLISVYISQLTSELTVNSENQFNNK